MKICLCLVSLQLVSHDLIMYRGLNYILFFLIYGVLSAQHSDLKKYVDSVYQSHWAKNNLNIDSISNIRLISIPQIKKDSIIIPKILTVHNIVSESIPVTPYSIIKSHSLRKWYVYGQNNLMFNQSSFSNWNSGGNNNFGVNTKINYSIIYKSGKHFLDNNFQFGYGLVYSRGQSSRKTDDYINISNNYGYDLWKNVYISAGTQFVSQFLPGFNYSTDPYPEYDDRISKFMAPGYVNIGLGLSFNPSENFQVIFRPATGRFTFVLDPKLQISGNYGLEREGQKIRYEFGALADIMYRINIAKKLSISNQINLFSSYINHPERVDISYTGKIDIRFNNNISTNIIVDLLYDHDQVKKLQVKQVFGVGFSYNLGIKTNDRPDDKKLVKPVVPK